MAEKKLTSRQELRQRIRVLEKDVEQLTSRLVDSTRELKRHQMWCRLDGQPRQPGRLQTLMNRMWVKLTRQLNA